MAEIIRFSAGRNTYDNSPEQIEVQTFDEMVEHMEAHRGRKKGQDFICGPMEYGAHDDPERHPVEAHFRLASHAKPCRFLTLDIDGMNGPEVQRFVLNQIKAVCSYAYETASSTIETPRMRVVFDLDREVSRDERTALGAAKQDELEAQVEAEFGARAIIFDPAVYRPEQPNYCPTEGAKTWKFLEGPPLVADVILTRATAVKKRQVGAGQIGGHEFIDPTFELQLQGPPPKHLAVRLAKGPIKNMFEGALRVLKTPNLLAQIDSAFEAIPSDDREVWVKLGHAAKALDVEGEDEGKQAWLRWSQKSEKFDPDDAERVWNTFHPTNTSHEQIFCEAEKHGWKCQSEHASRSASQLDVHTPRDDASYAPLPNEARQNGLQVVSYGGGLLETVAVMPQRDWKIPKLLLGRYISLIMGPGGVSKSMLQLIAAVSVATGRDLLGLGPVKQCNALVINNEDDEDELKRRIAAIALSFGIEPAELEGRLFTVSGYRKPVRFAHQINNSVQRSPRIADIEAMIRDRQIGALFVDPFISTHTVPENDNNAMDQVVAIFKGLGAELDIAINIAHHTRKSGGDPEAHAGDAEAGRGASSIKDAARAAVTVARMGKKTAEKLGIPDECRGDYIRIDVGKMNFAAHDSKASWFKIEPVKLKNGDTVGVPKPIDLNPLFAQAQEGGKKWTAESMAAAVSKLFPVSADKVPWADVKDRFMTDHDVKKTAAADHLKLLPQDCEAAVKVGAYKIWISRSAPNNGWMIHRREDDS